EIVDEIIYGDVSMPQGGTAIGVIALCQYATSWLTYKNHGMDKLLDGVPSVLIQNGQLMHEAMRKERVNEQEVMALLREQQIDDLREVKLGVLEINGQLAVIKQSWAEAVQKGDLGGEE